MNEHDKQQGIAWLERFLGWGLAILILVAVLLDLVNKIRGH